MDWLSINPATQSAATNHVKLDKGGVVGLITKCFSLVSVILVEERGQTELR